MATVPSRKKSLVGANGVMPVIDNPQPSSQLLNKSAASSTSLYQQCSQLRAKLTRIPEFEPFLALANPLNHNSTTPRQSHSTDPVTQLWDCFILGTPLCVLYNLLPGKEPLADINTEFDELDPENTKEWKRATAKFIIAITEMEKEGEWTPGQMFTISELHSKSRDTNGFVKVVNCIAKLLDLLPHDVFRPEEVPPSPPPPAIPAFLENSRHGDPNGTGTPEFSAGGGADAERVKVIRELVETERKYVGDLEVMREYATALGTEGKIDQDTIHYLFPGLNRLLDFQRQFLIVLEGIYELPWPQQRWGNAFASKEDEFAVYEPYCANYTNASGLLLVEEINLMNVSTMINSKSELPAFLIKPVQRICKYPLLLESLLKRVGSDYPYKEELVEGLNATKRITDRVNEAQRREENRQTVRNLEMRVDNWKGHHISHFGSLLLDEIFMVTKANVDREYHVFLFENIILCCQEVKPGMEKGGPNDKRKSGKSNSMLRKAANDRPTPPAPAGRKRDTPLLLKGRIFLNNVTSAVPSRKEGHSLQLWWRGDEDVEYFTLRCRNEEQLKQWESAVNKLINRDGNFRPPSSRPSVMSPPSASASQGSYTTQQLAHAQHVVGGRGRYPPQSSHYGSDFPMSPATPGSVNGLHTPVSAVSTAGSTRRERKDSRSDATTEDEYGFGDDRGYESPYASSSLTSGRATPSGMRKPHASMPAPHIPGRVPMMRGSSQASDSSFGSIPQRATLGGHHGPGSLKSQFSSSRLRNTFQEQSSRHPIPLPQQHLRMRSASTPTQYTPGQDELPPMPTGPMPIPPKDSSPWASHVSTAVSSLSARTTKSEDKRGSGSSQSTNDSSDLSQAQSPITPYGSNESASGVRPMRSQLLAGGQPKDDSVRVKVHYGQDLFMILVQRSIEYQDLMDRVGKKIRLCGARNDSSAFRVRYRDEDGDMISLASNDDLQIALDSREVILYVV